VRKLTVREFMVLDVLTGEWQSVSGLFLQTGIPDKELAQLQLAPIAPPMAVLANGLRYFVESDK
jgi:hypothetical protein